MQLEGRHHMVKRSLVVASIAGILLAPMARAEDPPAPEGFVSLFNGKDLAGWKVPAGDGGHWKVVDGVIDYDAQSEAKGDKALWGDRRVRRFRPPARLAAQGGALHQQERPVYPARWHPREGHPRQGDAAGAAGRGFRRLSPRRRPVPGQHLVLADRLGRDVQRPHRPARRPPMFAPPSRRAPRPTSRSASGTISRSPSGARRSPSC